MTKAIKKETPVGAEVSESKAIVAQGKNVVKSDAEIDAYIALRQQFIQKVNAICVEGKDYHVIQGKKSLAKGGAEKIASIFKWRATFSKDTESLEMLGAKDGLVAFKCVLANGEFVGEGRGAAMLVKNNGDPNKTLKMAQKSAFIDAVLRASGLSDFFTQDLEDMNGHDIQEPIKTVTPVQATTIKYASEKQLGLIRKLIQDKKVSNEKLTQALPNIRLTGDMPMDDARKMIEWLISYVPTYGEVSDESEVFIKALNDCETGEEYNQLKSEIQTAKANNKLSENAWKRIMDTALVVAERIRQNA